MDAKRKEQEEEQRRDEEYNRRKIEEYEKEKREEDTRREQERLLANQHSQAQLNYLSKFYLPLPIWQIDESAKLRSLYSFFFFHNGETKFCPAGFCIQVVTIEFRPKPLLMNRYVSCTKHINI